MRIASMVCIWVTLVKLVTPVILVAPSIGSSVTTLTIAARSGIGSPSPGEPVVEHESKALL